MRARPLRSGPWFRGVCALPRGRAATGPCLAPSAAMAPKPRRPPPLSTPKKPAVEATPSKAAIHARVAVDNADEVEVERVAFCPKRKQSVAVGVCEGCVHFEHIGQDEDGPVVHCAPPMAADGNRARLARSFDLGELALRVPVGEVMSRVVTCVRPETLLGKVRKLLVENGAACAPVINEDGLLLGIVSAQELLAAPDSMKAGDAMSRVALGIPEDAPLTHAVATMAQARALALPVIAGDGEVIGCVSALDAMRFFGRRWGYDMSSVELESAAPDE